MTPFHQGLAAYKEGRPLSSNPFAADNPRSKMWEAGWNQHLMIRVFWTNHGYYSQEEFTTLVAAVKYVQSKCFEAAFHQDDKVLAAWSPIGGLCILEVAHV